MLNAWSDIASSPTDLSARVVALAEGEHVLVLTLHHIVSDGWSMPVMVEELIQFYEGHRRGQPLQLPALAIQYADYAVWQRQWMEAGEQARQLADWVAGTRDHQGQAFFVVDKVQAELWGKPPYPPRTMVEVRRLFDDDIVEIDSVFYAPKKP
mgnify:CR=1 FL=1